MGFFRSIWNVITGRSGEAAKKDKADELKTIINNIPMGLYWKDANLAYKGVNTQFERLTNRPGMDLYGKTDMDIHAPETAALFRQEDLEFLSGERKGMYFVDKLVLKKDNSHMWGRTYKIPVYDDDNNILYIMGLIQDVTKIKQDEIALAESESRMRTILNATDDCIVFVGPHSKILATNGSFMNYFVPDKEDVTGMLLVELIAPEFARKLHESVEVALKSFEPQYFDLLPKESLTDKYFDVSIYPIIIKDEIVGIAIFVKDITTRKQTEEMLVKRSEELQAAIGEAEKASQSKSEFLSRMSHEIRTPIGAVIGMTKIASTTDDINKIRDCLQKIDSSSKHLLGIINDVLDMSKIEADKFVLSDEVFRLETMFMDIANLVGVRAGEKNQDFEVILDEDLPEYFYADELRLRQVVTNLLSNAIKFTPEKGIIRLYAKNLGITDGIAKIEMVVSDSGIGITKEQQAKLFQPFVQAKGGITRKFGGTGLGLVICKKIIEMMDGEIYIESSPEVGSKFIFNVKMKVHEIAKRNLGQKIDFSAMRALIVDDSFETREYLSHILTEFGIKCAAAEDGYKAVDIVSKTKNEEDAYNIFFVDWSMPGIDGIETTKQIRAAANDIAVVIMISITDWEKIEDDAVKAGVNRFIPKPLFSSTVFDVLNEIMGSKTENEPEAEEMKIPDLEGCRILLAEDIEINREIADALLEPTNVKIDFAVNGKEAVELYNANKDAYDMILMDIHMPEMDGYEATRLIRANADEKSQSIPIVAMTADAFKEDIDKCKAIGMNDHIAKPIDEKELFRKVALCKDFRLKSVHKVQAVQGQTSNVYLDENGALKRLNGNRNLYVKLLRRFPEDKSYDELKKCLGADDVEGARLAAHSIKGMAANLSLPAVYSEADRTEKMLINGEVDPSVLPELSAAMEKTIYEIEKFCSGR